MKLLVDEAWVPGGEPKHLILDLMKDSLVFTDDRKLLGFFGSGVGL